MRRRLLLMMIFGVVALAINAQHLVAEAPTSVAVGEQFRLTYTVKSHNVSDFHIGNLPDACEVLMGPNTSQQSNFTMVNGHTSSTMSTTFTYIVCINKKGTFNIPSAMVRVDGKVVKSNGLRITASGQARSQSGGGRSSQGGYDDEPELRTAGSRISGSDLFIRVSANKKRVHEQEPVLLTYKVYTLVSLTQLSGDMPDLKGFHTQEIKLPQQKSFKVETLNGKPYRTVTWSQYVLFPQITGKLEVPSITFNGIVVQQNRNIDPFEAFFNGGSGYVEVKKQIKAPGITIQVDPLPTRPTGFSGGVGKFNISAQLNKTEAQTNDPISLRIIVSGVGNLKLIKQPIVEFPKDFDTYDAKITDRTKLTSNGVEGSMIYDILAVPRHQGKYEISPIKFTYYDVNANAYKTIQSQGFTVNVAKGSGSSSDVADFSDNDDSTPKDIRGIKSGDVKLYKIGDHFFASTGYWISLAVLLVVFLSLFIVFRQQAIENANIGLKRGKKANKVATRRLKRASKLMKADNDGQFYDEVLHALWGYVGDKMGMPAEKLSRENVSQCLSERNVDADTIAQFIGALDECEFERYAPGDKNGNMTKTFDAAMTAIMKIEDSMKHSKKKTSKATIALLLMLLLPLSANAITKANADSCYVRQQYQQAIADYEEILKGGASADIYYNLGNAYYRMDNYTRAVINYERALLLSPGDKDIRFNLQMARSKTIDKVAPESEMFFVTWYNSLVNMTSVDGWAVTSLISLALAIVLALVYLFAERIWLRKFGFFGGGLLMVVFIVANIFAFQQKSKLENRDGAVVIVSSVSVKTTPSANSSTAFTLHEGTKVDITDGSMSGWKEIRIADGKTGWIPTKSLEII